MANDNCPRKPILVSVLRTDVSRDGDVLQVSEEDHIEVTSALVQTIEELFDSVHCMQKLEAACAQF